MTYPVLTVIKPNLPNGRIDPSKLTVVPLTGTFRTCHLYEPAARAWAALAAAVRREFNVTLTGSTPAPGDCYRSYDQQLAVFYTRYLPSFNPLKTSLVGSRIGPDGARWYKKLGVAAVATPGTSNHGLGIAIDCAIWTGTEAVGLTTNKPLFAWLLTNAARFGWSWESQSEPWHLRHVTGDNVTRAVELYELGLKLRTYTLESDMGILMSPYTPGSPNLWDDAVFAVSGGLATYVASTADIQTLRDRGLVQASGVENWQRSWLSALRLVGPSPTYPVGYPSTKSRTFPGDFESQVL